MDDESEVIYVLRIFHGGRFVNGNELVYVDGDVVENELDPNNVSYSQMLKVIRELRYRLEPYNGLDGAKDNGLDEGMNKANRDDDLDECLNVACEVDEHETFLIDVAYLCDNDDKEIKAIREKVKNFKVMNGKQKNEVKNIETPVHIVDEGIGEVLGERESESESDRINECEVAEDNTHGVSLDGKVQGYESDCMDSDDPSEYESELSDDEVHNHVKKTQIRARYKPRCVVLVWELGMRFENNKQFKDVVKKYAFAKRVQFCFMKNKPKRVRVRCMEGYP
ncbi:hypothetical protein REPUB_Repub09cG0065900 [Reevesia pubescens]